MLLKVEGQRDSKTPQGGQSRVEYELQELGMRYCRFSSDLKIRKISTKLSDDISQNLSGRITEGCEKTDDKCAEKK